MDIKLVRTNINQNYHSIRCCMFTFYNIQKANTPFTSIIYRGRSPYSHFSVFWFAISTIAIYSLTGSCSAKLPYQTKRFSQLSQIIKYIYIYPTTNTLSVATSTEVSESIRSQISFELFERELKIAQSYVFKSFYWR